MKVPHHGARSSLDLRWVAVTRPEVAVFSVGEFNPSTGTLRAMSWRHTGAPKAGSFVQTRIVPSGWTSLISIRHLPHR